MAKLKFPGAYIQHMDVRPNKGDTSWYARFDIRCDLTSHLAEKLDCQDMMECESTSGVVGLEIDEIFTSEAVLAKQGLENSTMEIVAHKLMDFRFVRHEDDGHVQRELRFHIMAPPETVVRGLAYVSAIHQSPALLTITTTKTPSEEVIAHQQTIDGGEEPVTGKKSGSGKKRGRPPTAATASASVDA